ncbi:MAG TPA: hypothetical protein VGT05_01600 [Patescibacteria group bacterium]|nr:hypothetical protein [Patescibacteria group bacterium]
MLSKEAVLEYQEEYRKIHGKIISFDEAMRQAEELLKLFDAIYKPIKTEWVKKNKKYGKHR